MQMLKGNEDITCRISQLFTLNFISLLGSRIRLRIFSICINLLDHFSSVVLITVEHGSARN